MAEKNRVLGALAQYLDLVKRTGDHVPLPEMFGGGLGSLMVGEAPDEVERWSEGDYPMESAGGANRFAGRLPRFKKGRAMPTADVAFSTPILNLPVRGAMVLPKAIKHGAKEFVESIGTTPSYVTAYHGSPHKFNKFDLSKVGTGEGAQAYGHGLYFADAPSVAKGYQNTLSYKDTVKRFREDLPDDADFDEVTSLIGTGRFSPYQDRVLSELHSNDWLGFDYPSQAISAAYRNIDDFDPTDSLRDAIKGSGNFYTVDIPDDAVSRMLRWDDSIAAQPDTVTNALGKTEHMGILDNGGTGKQYYTSLVQKLGSQEKASEYLRDLGIPGVRYLDAGSRRAGDGTYNTVLFDPDVATILKINDDIPIGTTPSYAIEPKGGNWLSGSVEGALRGLKSHLPANPVDRDALLTSERHKPAAAVDNWIDKQLTRYVKNDMATPEDPVRALAERGVLHVDPDALNYLPETYGKYPYAGQQFLAQGDLAKAWGDIKDLENAGMFRSADAKSGRFPSGLHEYFKARTDLDSSIAGYEQRIAERGVPGDDYVTPEDLMKHLGYARGGSVQFDPADIDARADALAQELGL